MVQLPQGGHGDLVGADVVGVGVTAVLVVGDDDVGPYDAQVLGDQSRRLAQVGVDERPGSAADGVPAMPESR